MFDHSDLDVVYILSLGCPNLMMINLHELLVFCRYVSVLSRLMLIYSTERERERETFLAISETLLLLFRCTVSLCLSKACLKQYQPVFWTDLTPLF